MVRSPEILGTIAVLCFRPRVPLWWLSLPRQPRPAAPAGVPQGAGGLSRRAVLGMHGLHPNGAAVLPPAWPSPRSVDVQEVFCLSVASEVRADFKM